MNLENGKAGEREDRPTPETDAECFVNDGDFVTGDFARRLERERDVARENTKAWHGEYRALNDLHRELGLEHKKALRQLEERDGSCERLAVVSLQLDDCKAQRARMLAALKALIDAPDYRKLSEFVPEELAAWAEAREAVAAVEGSAS